MGDFFTFEEPEKHEVKKSSVDFKLIIGVILLFISIILSIISGIVTLGGIYNLNDNALFSSVYLLAPVIIMIFLSSLTLIAGKNKRGRNFLIFSILALLLCSSNLSISIKNAAAESEKEKVAIEKMVSLVKDYMSQGEITREEIKEEKYGKSAPLIEVIQDNYIEFQQIKGEVESIGNIMNDPANFSTETLEDSDKIKEKIKILKKASTDTEELDKKIEQHMDNFKDELAEVYISKTVKEDVISELEETAKTSTETSSKSLEYMNEVIKSLKNMLVYLDGKQGEYVVRNDQVLFYKDQHVNEYNELLALYNKAIDDNNRNYQNILNMMNEKIKEMEEIAK